MVDFREEYGVQVALGIVSALLTTYLIEPLISRFLGASKPLNINGILIGISIFLLSNQVRQSEKRENPLLYFEDIDKMQVESITAELVTLRIERSNYSNRFGHDNTQAYNRINGRISELENELVLLEEKITNLFSIRNRE